MSEAPIELDTRRLLCPMPVIKTQDKIKQLRPGDLLRVVSTDPGALHDIPSWCRIHGHDIIETSTVDRDIFITILVNS